MDELMKNIGRSPDRDSVNMLGRLSNGPKLSLEAAIGSLRGKTVES